MPRRQTRFPSARGDFVRAASETPVLLNGMRVVFDEKVALYPVELEPDRPADASRKDDDDGIRAADRR